MRTASPACVLAHQRASSTNGMSTSPIADVMTASPSVSTVKTPRPTPFTTERRPSDAHVPVVPGHRRGHGNLWEETVWGGFVQGRLMAARGPLIGSLLTAVPFFLMHLPLAFEVNGWHGTTWHDALVDWGLILLAARFLRYLIGTLLIDTGGSTLAAGLMHASFNASAAMVVNPRGWQSIPAFIVLTLAVSAYWAGRGLSTTDEYVPRLVPALQGAAVAHGSAL